MYTSLNLSPSLSLSPHFGVEADGRRWSGGAELKRTTTANCGMASVDFHCDDPVFAINSLRSSTGAFRAPFGRSGCAREQNGNSSEVIIICCTCGGFLKGGYPKIIQFYGIVNYKPSSYKGVAPWPWKPPCVSVSFVMFRCSDFWTWFCNTTICSRLSRSDCLDWTHNDSSCLQNCTWGLPWPWGIPLSLVGLEWNIPSQWMMTGGSPF